MNVIQKLVLNINNLSMKELFEAENIYRLTKRAPGTGTILNEQTRLEMSLTMLYGKLKNILRKD